MARETCPAGKLAGASMDFAMGWDGRTANRLVHSNRSGGFQPGNEIQANHKYAVFQWVVFGPRFAGKVVHPASTGRKAARNEFNVE